MANRRLWMFNPGGATIPCCDEEEPVTPCCGPDCASIAGDSPLYLNDVNGTHEMTWYPAQSNWRVCYTLTHPQTFEPAGAGCGAVGEGTTAVEYNLSCHSSFGTFVLVQKAANRSCSGAQRLSRDAVDGGDDTLVSPAGVTIRTLPVESITTTIGMVGAVFPSTAATGTPYRYAVAGSVTISTNPAPRSSTSPTAWGRSR